ncbi:MULTISPECIES: tetratricopeptide repeat protein [Leptospira]
MLPNARRVILGVSRRERRHTLLRKKNIKFRYAFLELFRMRFLIILSLTWTFFSSSLSSEIGSLQETQAENLLRIAEEAYKDQKFHRSIEEIKNFLILYPTSKLKYKAYQVLKNNYSRLGRPEKVLEINLYQYSQEPTSSQGLNAFFEVGKLYLQIGEKNKAKEVFKSICTQSFSRELAEKASLEFSEWDILNDSKTETSECGENTSFFRDSIPENR